MKKHKQRELKLRELKFLIRVAKVKILSETTTVEEARTALRAYVHRLIAKTSAK